LISGPTSSAPISAAILMRSSGPRNWFFTAMYARLLKTITSNGTRYLARVQSPWMPNIALQSPKQATTRRWGDAKVAPIAAPSPHPRCPAEELEKYDLARVNWKLDMRMVLLVGLSLTIKAPPSMSLSIVRISRAALIGVASQPALILFSSSALV